MVDQHRAHVVVPGWNAPQGVENVHTLCAGKPESDDRGNNMFVKRLETICIKRYINPKDYYYYILWLRLLCSLYLNWLNLRYINSEYIFHIHVGLHTWIEIIILLNALDYPLGYICTL